jgi:hypothetical protein
MIACASFPRTVARAASAAAFLAMGLVLSGCAGMSENMTTAFADPAKYELYDCKQLEPERKALANREAELQGLMAKAQSGTAGPLVAEMAYRNEYVAVSGQAHFAEEAWRKNKCHETPPGAPAAASPGTPPVKPAPPHGRAG